MKFRLVFVFAFVIWLTGCEHKQQIPPMEVSAHKVMADYEENSAEASKKYEGQNLIITGNVFNQSQLREVIGAYLESLNPSSEWRIVCLIDKSSQPDAYSILERKRNIIFKGMIERAENSQVLSLKNCVVE